MLNISTTRYSHGTRGVIWASIDLSECKEHCLYRRVSDVESHAASQSLSLHLALLVKSTLQLVSQLFHSSVLFASQF